ncbi:hypothetical protein [Mycobacterium sp. RTGN5]|uniref:hypothetical protein n=1 Tax=Mycobacterium sp. RTGN5 TaxID=3016522 RepID=UPI0029C87343|nr:hypothetical protein [Mycobacterium sp. RTGN5]
MQRAARRPMLAVAAMTTAGALALAPISVAPPELHTPAISAARVSTQAVQLTDAWSDLANHTRMSVVGLTKMFLGTDNNYPLPSPTLPLAPVATQLVLNQVIYVAQLLTGKGGQIPGEIVTHLQGVGTIAVQVLSALPEVIGEGLKVPFVATQLALESIGAAPNPLAGLLFAPAIFLDVALNSPAGLLGQIGPIGFGLIVRNALAKAIYTTPPAGLPFKKAAAAKSATASSTRAKPKAPASSRKAVSAKASNGGARHSKRG